LVVKGAASVIFERSLLAQALVGNMNQELRGLLLVMSQRLRIEVTILLPLASLPDVVLNLFFARLSELLRRLLPLRHRFGLRALLAG